MQFTLLSIINLEDKFILTNLWSNIWFTNKNNMEFFPLLSISFKLFTLSNNTQICLYTIKNPPWSSSSSSLACLHALSKKRQDRWKERVLRILPNCRGHLHSPSGELFLPSSIFASPSLATASQDVVAVAVPVAGAWRKSEKETPKNFKNGWGLSKISRGK